MQRAAYLAQSGKPDDAATERKLALDPQAQATTAMDSFLVGKLLMSNMHSTDRRSAGVELFAEALRREPTHFWAHYFTAICYIRAEQWALAQASLASCTALRPEFPWIYVLKGSVAGELREFDRAEADFRDALDKMGADRSARYIALVNRGVMRAARGRYPTRSTIFAVALSLSLRNIRRISTWQN